MNDLKPIWADNERRIRLPWPAKRNSGWIPVLATEREMRFIAYEKPASPPRAKGRVIMGKHGWLVWKGELISDPVVALNTDRQEDAHG
jgi:hypothetical protein